MQRGASALKIYYRLPFASAKAVIDVCNARRIPCTAHLELLDARELIAAGLHGIEHELELEPAYSGNAYLSDVPRVPTSLREAAELFAGSEIARTAFGDEVVEHYLNNARIEVEAYDAAVTDWERVRGFERL